jgi:hypothetical protein
MGTYKTLKAAKADGFHKPKAWEYGGELLRLKNHTLVRNPKEAVSRHKWSARGYRIKTGATPHANQSHHVAGRTKKYPVYRDDQVIGKRRVTECPAVEIPILLAVWALNRSAKRYRDSGQSHYLHANHGLAGHAKNTKENYYDLKAQALEQLLTEGKLTVMGYQLFGENKYWTEVLQGDGFTFHRPCARPSTQYRDCQVLETIPAKERSAREPRVKDAIYTVENYLAERCSIAA